MPVKYFVITLRIVPALIKSPLYSSAITEMLFQYDEEKISATSKGTLQWHQTS